MVVINYEHAAGKVSFTCQDCVLPMQDMQEYDALCEKLKEMSTLGGISGLLG